jgi:hypothetical protein
VLYPEALRGFAAFGGEFGHHLGEGHGVVGETVRRFFGPAATLAWCGLSSVRKKARTVSSGRNVWGASAAYLRSMSFTVLPAGIMGRTCSV